MPVRTNTLHAVSSRLRLWLLLGPVIVGTIAGYVGAALHPTLAVENPVLLIILNPRNYHLALVAGQIAFSTFVVVAFLRLITLDPLLYLIGRWYGPAGRRWIERQVEGSGRMVAFVDRWFPKIGWLFVFIAPNLIISLLAGVTRMRPIVFATLNVTGTITRILLVWWLAERFEGPLDSVLDFFNRYQRPATFVAIGLVVLQVVLSTRKGSGELSDVRELEQELEEELDGAAPRPAEGTADEEMGATDDRTGDPR